MQRAWVITLAASVKIATERAAGSAMCAKPETGVSPLLAEGAGDGGGAGVQPESKRGTSEVAARRRLGWLTEYSIALARGSGTRRPVLGHGRGARVVLSVRADGSSMRTVHLVHEIGMRSSVAAPTPGVGKSPRFAGPA